ncbi:aryl-alcohol oxidase [Mycena filopes]|nr:aryl-alcohol oxidase [Mycena filopes]
MHTSYSSSLHLLLLFFSLALCGSASGKIFEAVGDLPGLKYDFVIAGGGTAGLVVATRLTENPAFSVLVLEAGVDSAGVLDSEVPFLVNDLLGPNVYDWNYTTTPQVGLNGRVIPYLRAHMLGGCSAHNIMFYTRGGTDDYDRYANLTDDAGWSWDRIFPYFLKNEKWTPPADLHDTTGQFDPSAHSTHGVTPVSLPGFAWPVGPRVMQALEELPDAFPYNRDMNAGNPLGWLQSTIGGGKRSTSASSYLAPVAERRNLHVLLHARVTRLVQPTFVHGELMFGGVEFLHSDSSVPLVAKARKETILSAGAIGTPTILLHSGVGDKTALQALGIPSLLHLPSVGQNLSDHPSFALAWSVNSNLTIETISENATAFNEALAQWNATHTGPMVDVGVTHVGWLRLDADAPIFETFKDPSAGPNAGHLELIFEAGFTRRPAGTVTPQGHFMDIAGVVVTPISRGSVTINSSNPLDPPLIDPAFFTSEFDLYVAREAIKKAQHFVTAPVWRDYILAQTVDMSNFTTEQLNQFIRGSAASINHPVGTAGMAARGAPYGVVDPDLRVKGTRGLAVIDASVLPIVPSAHTQAATYVVAERGADLVKARWGMGRR